MKCILAERVGEDERALTIANSNMLERADYGGGEILEVRFGRLVAGIASGCSVLARR
jgi:hypothetical protein